MKHWPVSNDCTEKLVWNIEKLSKAVPETEGKDRRGEEALGTVIVAVPTVMSQVKGLETVTALLTASPGDELSRVGSVGFICRLVGKARVGDGEVVGGQSGDVGRQARRVGGADAVDGRDDEGGDYRAQY